MSYFDEDMGFGGCNEHSSWHRGEVALSSSMAPSSLVVVVSLGCHNVDDRPSKLGALHPCLLVG
jgi:hypothetical protein